MDRRFTRIIDRLLRKNPAARYPSAQALLEELEALGPLGAGTRTIPTSTEDADTRTRIGAAAPRTATERLSVEERRQQRQRAARKHTIVLASAAGLLLVLAACVVLWAISREDRAARGTAAARKPIPRPTAAPDTPPKPRDPREEKARACFRHAYKAAESKRWRTARKYLARLGSDYADTKFHATNRRHIDELAARIETALRPAPAPSEPPARGGPARDWIDLAAPQNLSRWRPVSGLWLLEPATLMGGAEGAPSVLECGLPPAEDMELTLEVMQAPGRIGDDVQIVFACDGPSPLLRLYWDGSALCCSHEGRCAVLGELDSVKGGQWVKAGLRIQRGRATAWVGDTKVESVRIRGTKPRRVRILQSSSAAIYRNVRFRVLPSDPKYRRFYERQRPPGA